MKLSRSISSHRCWHCTGVAMSVMSTRKAEKISVKRELETMIESTTEERSIECCICYSVINRYARGVMIITCGGMADLEHVFCESCNKKFTTNDPYKRRIVYRFTYPFEDEAAAKDFISKSRNFILSDGDDVRVESFKEKVNDLGGKSVGQYEDVEYSFKLFDDPE
ncbi:hypothetical protein SlGVgp127 [Spodoptera litura granulovirus]|uniref:Ac53 n=1 Tax=Spodoptera litura granulovirus TaxID=359919 RepID=A5IZX9_9BBAC|nr:hypothetical protein SlGVgp127 [Spodoptera litura granulovirus]ABQ52070.1 hypothetical protein SlGVgp127 [Spodoptera litura granulovirus]